MKQLATAGLLLASLILFVSPATAGSEDIYSWSITASQNATADSGINWQENQLPGTVNDSARSVMAAVAKHRDDNNGSRSTAGSSNAYTYAAAGGFSNTPFSGATLTIKASFSNTSSATLNVTPSGGVAWGAKAIKVTTVNGEADLGPSQIRANGIYRFVYDTTANSGSGAWLLLNPSGGLSKVITATRDVTASSGSVAYTGVGFKPTRLRIMAFRNAVGIGGGANNSEGFSDSSLTQAARAFAADTGVVMSATGVIVIYSDVATANSQNAAVASYDSDGFTLSWTKTGSLSAATLNLYILAER
jgi:hypothetical protein